MPASWLYQLAPGILEKPVRLQNLQQIINVYSVVDLESKSILTLLAGLCTGPNHQAKLI